MKHRKGIDKEYFEKILSGEKTYELRLANFECNPGDVLLLYEKDEDGNPTGREMEKEVTYVGKTKRITFWSKEDIEKYGFQIISFK